MNEISREDVIELAKEFDVDQSDMLETFICDLLNISPDKLYEQIDDTKHLVEVTFEKIYRVSETFEVGNDEYLDIKAGVLSDRILDKLNSSLGYGDIETDWAACDAVTGTEIQGWE